MNALPGPPWLGVGVRVQVFSSGILPNLPPLELRASSAMLTKSLPRGSRSSEASCAAFNDHDPVTR